MITVFVITLLAVLQNLNETLLDLIFGILIYLDHIDNFGEVFLYHLDNPGRDHSFALALYALNCEALALRGESENISIFFIHMGQFLPDGKKGISDICYFVYTGKISRE